MKWIAVLALCAATARAEAPSTPQQVYTADVVVVTKGETSRSHVVSDGVRTASRSGDGKSGSFIDREKKLRWVYGPSFGCLQMALQPEGYTSSSKEQLLGRETIDGHPTEKYRVTSVMTNAGKTTTNTLVEWRATDLKNLVIHRKSESEDFEQHLEKIIPGKADPAALTLPSPPCKYDAVADTSRYAAEGAGGFRTVPFFDASCKQIVPLPLTVSIPSDYAIRSGGPRGCLWGAADDLDRVLANRSELDFDSIHRGVFWCRVATSTQYDPVSGFTSEFGPQPQWTRALKSAGARDVTVESAKIGDIPAARIMATMNGQRAYMLYLAVPGTDSPAILINYHPAGRGTAADDAAWLKFVGSIARAPAK